LTEWSSRPPFLRAVKITPGATQDIVMFEHITGIILAGGNSKRMGKDKALLPLPGNKGVTFVEYLSTMLAMLCREVLLIARDEPQRANYAHLKGVRTLTDRVSGYGPLMGLSSGLSAIQNLHALVVAVDMPFVQPALLAFLLNQPLTGSLLVPVVNNVPQVLLAIYPRAVLPLIEERLQEGRRDPRSLLEVAPVRYIDETQIRQVDPELRSFINVNTPGELSIYT
jgi:molybdenum cofactor guanylyltransferase